MRRVRKRCRRLKDARLGNRRQRRATEKWTTTIDPSANDGCFRVVSMSVTRGGVRVLLNSISPVRCRCFSSNWARRRAFHSALLSGQPRRRWRAATRSRCLFFVARRAESAARKWQFRRRLVRVIGLRRASSTVAAGQAAAWSWRAAAAGRVSTACHPSVRPSVRRYSRRRSWACPAALPLYAIHQQHGWAVAAATVSVRSRSTPHDHHGAGGHPAGWPRCHQVDVIAQHSTMTNAYWFRRRRGCYTIMASEVTVLSLLSRRREASRI